MWLMPNPTDELVLKAIWAHTIRLLVLSSVFRSSSGLTAVCSADEFCGQPIFIRDLGPLELDMPNDMVMDRVLVLIGSGHLQWCVEGELFLLYDDRVSLAAEHIRQLWLFSRVKEINHQLPDDGMLPMEEDVFLKHVDVITAAAFREFVN